MDTKTLAIVPLGDGAELSDPTRTLGGKGAQLDELVRLGLPVPRGFCLTTAFLGRGEFTEEEVRQIKAAFEQLGAASVAVRSSAPDEDGTNASAAGIHETVLGVTTGDRLIDAVETCRASATSDRSRAYYGDATTGEMAVVVQELIDADVSGVLFTVDPLNPHSGQMVVEAAWGAGEGIVRGEVSTDSYRLDSSGAVVDSTVARKKSMIQVGDACATYSADVPRDRVDIPCLEPETLRRLAEIAREVVAQVDGEADIEFCVRDGRIHLLQARPVTATAALPKSPYVVPVPEDLQNQTMWSRVDIGEIFNGIMTPMGLSLARYYQDHVHLACVRSTGIRSLGNADLHMGYLGGYVYLNISYTAHLLQQSPPSKDQQFFTERFRSVESGGIPYQNPFGQLRANAAVPGAAFWVASTAKEMLVMKRRSRAMTASRHREFDAALSDDLTILSTRELLDRLDKALDYFHATHVGYMPYYFNAAGFYKLLAALCQRWLNGASVSDVVDGVKSDVSALRTVRTAADLADLARLAQSDPEVQGVLLRNPPGQMRRALEASRAGTRFIDDGVRPFMREHGTRGRQEMELSHPRWVDDWTYVLQMVRTYLREPGLLEVINQHQNQRADSSAPLEGLNPVKRRILRGVIGAYGTFSELREVTRMSMVTGIWLVRRVVMECARRAVEAGHIDNTDDVWFLDIQDVHRYLRGETSASEVFSRKFVEEGRRRHQRDLNGPQPPMTIIGTWAPDESHVPSPQLSVRNLTGLGVSPGVAEGVARVVTDLGSQAEQFRADEILVTTFTDASWTPLFAMAGGVVADNGSLLSHSSIVSRELGIPSVVNTLHGTTQINTGDRIRIDGRQGTVEVVERAGQR